MINDEQYCALARGNVANILYAYYSLGKEAPKEVIDNIDFTEEFEKTVYFPIVEKKKHYADRHDIKENNILNCIKYLPFEAYEKYMTPKWIYEKGMKYDISTISTAIYFSKRDVLEKCFTMIEKEVKTIDYKKEIGSNEIENSYFKQVLNLSSFLRSFEGKENGPSEDGSQFIYDFFKKNLKLFDVYYNEKRKVFKFDTKDELFHNWHKKYDHLKMFFSTFNNKEDLNQLIISNKHCWNILKDAIEQYGENDKNPFASQNSVIIGLGSANFNYLNYMIKNNHINLQNLADAYNHVLSEQAEKFSKSLDSQYQNSIEFPKFKKIAQLDAYLKKNGVNVEYNPKSALAVVLCDSKNSKEMFFNIPDVEKIKILDELNVHQLSFLNKYIDSLLINIKVGKKINSEKDLFLSEFSTREIYVVKKVSEWLPNPVLSLKEKEEALLVLSRNNNKYLNGGSFDFEKAKIILRKEELDEKLKVEDLVIKKHKI